MIVISSKAIGVDIILNDGYCNYKKDTDEVIIDVNRLQEVLEEVYKYGLFGYEQPDSIEFGTNR